MRMTKRKGKRHKNAVLASIISIIAIVVASPLDDILLWGIIGRTFLTIPWHQSVILGAVLGLIAFILLEDRF